MDCYLVVLTKGDLRIPAQYKNSCVMLSKPYACVVSSGPGTTEEISRTFGIGQNRWGVVVKLDAYSGIESAEVIDKWNRLEGSDG